MTHLFIAGAISFALKETVGGMSGSIFFILYPVILLMIRGFRKKEV